MLPLLVPLETTAQFLSPVLFAFNFLHKQNRKWSKKYDMETSVFFFFFLDQPLLLSAADYFAVLR